MKYSFLLLLLIPRVAVADLGLKGLIFKQCDAALKEFSALPEAEQSSFMEYSERVLSLKSVQVMEEINVRENRPLSLPSSSTAPAIPPIGGDDFMRSVDPTREVDAKICVAKIATQKPELAANLLPGLFLLENSPLVSFENRQFLRNVLVQIAQSARSQPLLLQTSLEKISRNLAEKQAWLLRTLIVESFPGSRTVLASMLAERDELLFHVAESSLKTVDRDGELTANLLLENRGTISHRRFYSLISLTGSAPKLAPAAFRLVLSELAEGDAKDAPQLFSLLATAGEASLKEMLSGDESRLQFVGILRRYSPDQLRPLITMACGSGSCDAVFAQLLPEAVQSADAQRKLLALIAYIESFSADLWKFTADSFSPLNPSIQATALEASAAFPGKKEAALKFLGATLRSISKSKSGADANIRGDLLRAVARSLARLNPVPASYLPADVGLEILGLSGDEGLPAQGISAVRPLPLGILLTGISSKSESTKAQALSVIEKTRPIDEATVSKVLALAPIKPERPEAKDGITADRVLSRYEDLIVPVYEKLLRSGDKFLAAKAAFRLLERRPTNEKALKVLFDQFSKFSCDVKLAAGNSLRAAAGKQMTLSALKGCAEQLLRSLPEDMRNSELRKSSSPEEWSDLLKEVSERVKIRICDWSEQPLEVLENALDSASSGETLHALECLAHKLGVEQPEERIVTKLTARLEEVKEGPLARSLLAAVMEIAPDNRLARSRFLELLKVGSDAKELGREVSKANEARIVSFLEQLESEVFTTRGFMEFALSYDRRIPLLHDKLEDCLREARNDEELSRAVVTATALGLATPLLEQKRKEVELSPQSETLRLSQGSVAKCPLKTIDEF